MKQSLAILILMLTARGVVADGTTDFVINPAVTTVISAPGSYRLVQDVVMTENFTAIQIDADNVTIDLNGHSITGGATSLNPGITGISVAHAVVLNGRVSEFGGRGIDLGNYAVIRDCAVFGNNRTGFLGGITVGLNSVVERCSVVGNTTDASGGSIGISTQGGCRVAENVVENNDSPTALVIGINTQGYCFILNNTVRGNTGVSNSACIGINAGLHCLVRGNVVSDNDNAGTGDATGIVATAGGIIEGNTCSDHQTGASGSAFGTGISVTSCKVTDNDCMNNGAGEGSAGTGRGINLVGGCVARNNRCEGNSGLSTGFSIGIAATGGSRIENNYCRSHSSGAGGWGIRITGTGNLVTGNSTQANGSAGIYFVNAGNNRVQSNMFRETLGIDPAGAAPSSVGAGDLANVVF